MFVSELAFVAALSFDSVSEIFYGNHLLNIEKYRFEMNSYTWFYFCYKPAFRFMKKYYILQNF